MRLLLLGATGTTGRALTEKILKEMPDCQITLFARHADKIKMNEPRIRIMCGDASDIQQLKVAVKGQDVVYSAISGSKLPVIAENLVQVMKEQKIERLIFTGAVGIYNEIPENNGSLYNVDNEPPQVPNRIAVDIIEASNLNYTIFRPGFLRDGDENDYVITKKGESAKGYVTTLPSVIKIAHEILKDNTKYVKESISITKDMSR